VAVVNELLGVGSAPGDQLFLYACDGGGASEAGSYLYYAPVVLNNAPLS
jgi:hypothetical protein